MAGEWCKRRSQDLWEHENKRVLLELDPTKYWLMAFHFPLECHQVQVTSRNSHIAPQSCLSCSFEGKRREAVWEVVNRRYSLLDARRQWEWRGSETGERRRDSDFMWLCVNPEGSSVCAPTCRSIAISYSNPNTPPTNTLIKTLRPRLLLTPPSNDFSLCVTKPWPPTAFPDSRKHGLQRLSNCTLSSEKLRMAQILVRERPTITFNCESVKWSGLMSPLHLSETMADTTMAAVTNVQLRKSSRAVWIMWIPDWQIN